MLDTYRHEHMHGLTYAPLLYFCTWACYIQQLSRTVTGHWCEPSLQTAPEVTCCHLRSVLMSVVSPQHGGSVGSSLIVNLISMKRRELR